MFEQYGYSNYVIKRYISLFGAKKTKELLDANKRKPRKSIRVNTLKISLSSCRNLLKKKGFVLSKIPWANGFFVDKEPSSIAATTEHLLGYYYIQDASSMIPPVELNPKTTDTVLDMTAAPGGKLCHLAEIMKNKGAVVGLDINREKMQAVRSNVQRMGVTNSVVYRMDAKDVSGLGIKFDKILLDAPCTGEGTIGKNPERKNLQKKDFDHYSSLQKELLSGAFSVLKPGGIILYSTCSLAPEENEMVVEWAAEKFKASLLNLSTRDISKGLTYFFGRPHLRALSKCGRLYPHIHDTQGFFLAKLKKKAK
ncbi:MAG TPA: RsmB/NOP family class I SAM-dependent RNA methyltransferase [Candidatus Woesearchaeota archaeon]|nr:RsmB/NOP family class I SAM-dependent RNA methyltransferase [Candidatus Woesearchaeota archaeon]